jgi:hypothetical protein
VGVAELLSNQGIEEESVSTDLAVLDAKYKMIDSEDFKNFDVYQVISYATALGVNRAFLVYPDTACDHAWDGNVLNSPICVSVKTVSLSQPGVPMRDQARTLARNVLSELKVEAAAECLNAKSTLHPL